VARLRKSGVTDAEIAEVIAAVALKIFTNYFGIFAGTDVDFPKAAPLPGQPQPDAA
jgi:alkylhydroperoxidase family enzyme